MKRGLGLSLSIVVAALLLVPTVASASDQWRMHGRQWRDDIRRQVREAMRDARNARFAARRDMYRAWARNRQDVRQAIRQAHREALRAGREFRRSWRD